jgi:glutathione S-transferase
MITLYHAANTRSFRALWLLEELGVDYRLVELDLRRGEHRTPEMRRLNPMAKVPLVVVDGHPVWESPAIIAHLCDLYPQSGLSPQHGTPGRADFYRWLSFGTAVMEPVFFDHVTGREVDRTKVGWGDFPSMIAALADGLAVGDWILGDRFSGADILIGGNLHWFSLWAAAAFADLRGGAAYFERVRARPAFIRAEEKDAAIAARQRLAGT